LLVLSLAFILALVLSAVVLLIGIVIFSEIAEAMELRLPTGSGTSQIDGKFYGIEGGSSATVPLKVYEINKTAFSTTNTAVISSVTMTGLGFTATGVNGLARDPTDGTFYGVAKDQANATNRRLISINPVTGVAVDIGGMGNKFTTLGINGDGTLRTITGLGAAIPLQFHSVDKTTGQTTLLCTFVPPVVTTVGSFAFNSKDGNMYWLYGFSDLPTTDELFLIRIDNQSTCAFTIIPETGLSVFLDTIQFLEVIGLTYSITDDLFYGTALNVGDTPFNPPPKRIQFTVTPTGSFSNLIHGSFPTLATFTDVKSLAFDVATGGATFTPSEQQEIDTFNNAQAIGFTVIGIFPIALFFALFSIFSGRIE